MNLLEHTSWVFQLRQCQPIQHGPKLGASHLQPLLWHFQCNIKHNLLYSCLFGQSLFPFPLSKCIAWLSSKAIAKIMLVVVLDWKYLCVWEQGVQTQVFLIHKLLFWLSQWSLPLEVLFFDFFSWSCLGVEWGRWARWRKEGERERGNSVCEAWTSACFLLLQYIHIFRTGGFIALIMLRSCSASQSCTESSDPCTFLENLQRFHNGPFGFNGTLSEINLHK